MSIVRVLAVSILISAAAWAQSGPLWIDVPFAGQTRDGCGSASLSMVMRYWEGKRGTGAGAVSDAAEIQRSLYSSSAKGIYASAMQDYLRRAGYDAFLFDGEWKDLQHHLSQGRPLIVALKASGARGPLHYVVVVGIDPERGFVFVNDPAQQKMLRLSREGFESEWKGSRHWTLLAVPKS